MPAAWRSTASPTARSCARVSSTRFGCSRPRAMPAERWARRSSAITRISIARASSTAQGPTACMAAYLGPSFEGPAIERALRAAGAKFAKLGDDELIDATAQALADGKAVGWMQGRMEYGPRALGARSILADPRSPSHAEDPQPQGQIPRELPAFRAVGAARRGRLLGSSSTPIRRTCFWWRRCARSGGGR